MPNQRDIAESLGISQAAVSLALRGHPSISVAMQRKVRQKARQLGYRPNPYVSTLMAHIQSGRKPSEKGVIALVVDVFKRQAWFGHESYKVYHQGVVKRSAELGFRTEYFFLQDDGLTMTAIDRILHARGIRGVILAPPYLGNSQFVMTWDRYACVGTGYGWEQQTFDRVAHDHDQNAVIASRNLCDLGYSRIGLRLPAFYARGRGTRWIDGFLAFQQRLPAKLRLPILIGTEEEKEEIPEFKNWLNRWRPDALLTLYGHEHAWLKRCGLRCPEDIGLACLIRPPGLRFAGINDRYAEVGAATVDLVASKIAFNQFGIPPFPKIMLIEGHWMPGRSLKPGKPGHRAEVSPD